MIGVYIEGVKDGRRFVQALREAAAAKPVILLKGGTTSAGTRAVGSHTGALAGSEEVWNALCLQTGVIRVENLDEVVDLALLLKYAPPPRGRRVGILTFGGGRGVRSADECESAGLTVPELPDKVRWQLADFTPHAGTSVRNPVDSTAVVALNVELFSRTTELIIDSGVIDILVVYVFVEFMYPELPHLLEQHVEAAAETARRYRKPVAVVLSTTGDRLTADLASRGMQAGIRAGVPTYPSIGRAAAALSRFVAYHEDRRLRDS
jgi:acyl-CoA synthetase (NDP forming)